MSKQNMIKIFNSLNYKRDLFTTFSDFTELAALSISNSIDKSKYKPREEQYLRIIRKYNKDEAEIFPKLLGELVDELESNPKDILGQVFMELELGSKWKGQFFTPFEICELTAEITFNDKDIKSKGYITFNEPCCGAGAMIIAFANVMRKKGYNPQKQLKIICNDIDSRCVHMTYVQLSLLGLQAVIYQGNTLTLEITDVWRTPMWLFRNYKDVI